MHLSVPRLLLDVEQDRPDRRRPGNAREEAGRT